MNQEKKEMIISTQIKLTSEGLAENKISMFRECAISLDVLNAGGYTEDYKQYKRVTHEIIGCILREFDSDKFITITTHYFGVDEPGQYFIIMDKSYMKGLNKQQKELLQMIFDKPTLTVSKLSEEQYEYFIRTHDQDGRGAQIAQWMNNTTTHIQHAIISVVKHYTMED
jgi:hypothetical protein